jgi:hypothetical protein
MILPGCLTEHILSLKFLQEAGIPLHLAAAC